MHSQYAALASRVVIPSAKVVQTAPLPSNDIKRIHMDKKCCRIVSTTQSGLCRVECSVQQQSFEVATQLLRQSPIWIEWER